MTDILIPTNRTVYCVGVKRAGQETVSFMSSHPDHLTAYKAINRLNFVNGHRTGDLYLIEEKSVSIE